MKKLLSLLALLLIVSCADRNPNGSVKLYKYKHDGAMGNPNLVEVDSCEYIAWGHGLAHKGDCKYCAERRKKEIKEVLNEYENDISSKNDRFREE